MFDRLFNPNSVAIVGASSNPEKIGYAVIKNMVESGFSGSIFPVNLNAATILKLKAYRTLKSIGMSPDIVIIAVPSAAVPEEIRNCVELKVPYAVIIPGGFSETGSEGQKLENEIRRIIAGSATRVIGPNTVGVYFPHSKVNTALTPPDRVSFPPAGSIAFVSQSGALGLLTMDSISEYGVGISAFVSLGNKLDVNEIEMLKYFSEDGNTKSIALYLEDIDQGREFYSVARNVNAIKPIVVLKSGRSEASAKAASLHTGAMASDDRVIDGMLKQGGITRAYNETELLDYARTLAYGKPFPGRNIAVITTAGGVGVITTDLISSRINGVGLSMATISRDAEERIKVEIVSFGSAKNPIDLTADGSIRAYEKVLEILMKEESVDAIVAYALPQTPKMNLEIVDAIARHVNDGKTVVVGAIGSLLAKELIVEFERRKIPAFPSIDRAVKSLKVLHDYGKYLHERGRT